MAAMEYIFLPKSHQGVAYFMKKWGNICLLFPYHQLGLDLRSRYGLGLGLELRIGLGLEVLFRVMVWFYLSIQ